MWASQPIPAPHPQPMESPAVFRNTRSHSSLSISSGKNLFNLSIWMKSTRLQLEALWWHKSSKTRGSRWLLLLKRVLGDSCSICRNVGSCTGYSGEDQLKIQWFQFWYVQFPVCIFLFSKFIYFYLKANHNIVLVSATQQHASGIGNTLYMLRLVAQSCRALCNSWTVAHQAPLSMGILQAGILEWIAMPFFRGSSQPRDEIQVSCIAGDSLPSKPPAMPHTLCNIFQLAV